MRAPKPHRPNTPPKHKNNNKTKKKALDVRFNALEGGVPGCMFASPALTELYLGRNQLSGALPAVPASSGLEALYQRGGPGGALTGAFLPSCGWLGLKQERGARARSLITLTHAP